MIDEISYKILKILQEKARIPNAEVARRIGMAPSAVLERIRKLEHQGIIDGYEVRLNPDRFGRSLVAFVTVKIMETHGKDPIGPFLAEIPEVQEVHYITGDDSYLLKVRVSDTMVLEQVLREKITIHSAVQSTSTAIALSTLKETYRIPINAPDC